MKKITFLLVLISACLFACSDDDGGSTQPDTFSAHMKYECPSNSETELYDYCINEAVFDYLLDLREDAGNDACLLVSFETLDGEVIEGYLIRPEKNIVDCPAE